MTRPWLRPASCPSRSAGSCASVSSSPPRAPPSTPAAVYDLIVPPRTPSGRPIRRTQPIQTINEILSLVARGRIIHPTSSAVPMFNRDDVVLIPIDDLPPIPLGLVWCTSRDNPRIRALNETARSMIESLGTIPDTARPSTPAKADGE